MTDSQNDTLFPFAIGNSTSTFFSDPAGQPIRNIQGEATASAQFDALAYALLVQSLHTTEGDDVIQSAAEAEGGLQSEARGLSIGDATGLFGFLGTGSADLGAGDDRVVASASVTVSKESLFATSADASGMTVDLGSGFDSGSGTDRLRLSADASVGPRNGNKDLLLQASGFEALGDVRLGDGDDIVRASGTADSNGADTLSTQAFGITQITSDANAAGRLNTSADALPGTVTSDNDSLTGTATARGESDVQAHGFLITDTVTGDGADSLDGTAIATGLNVAKANGIAVGLSNNTDNQGRTLLEDDAGTLSTGDGADNLTAFADAKTASNGEKVVSDANVDANGLLVDLDSRLDLGGGENTITATGIAADKGVGGVDAIAVTADGIENRGTLLGGDVKDIITGIAEAHSQGGIPLTIAGGIDNGFGSTRNDIPVDPTISTGGGGDSITGEGTVTATGGIGLASGIETSGTLDTGAGGDKLTGKGASTVTDGIRSVSDGVENATLLAAAGLIDLGDGDDKLVAVATATGKGGLLDPDGEFGPETIGTTAEAIGIRNDFEDLVNDPALNESDGTIELGAGANQVRTEATAVSELGKAFAFGLHGGTINGGDEGNTITGSATATAGDDAAAFGLRFTNGTFGSGKEVITGTATADGKGSSEVRAVSVGVSDVDDDALSPPEIVARVGSVHTGAGDDSLTAVANLTIDAGADDQVFFGGTNGIVVDGAVEAQWRQIVKENAQELADAVNSGQRFAFTNAVQPLLAELDTSTLDTGDGQDSLDVTVTFNGGGAFEPEENDLEYIADAVETAGLLTLGAGDDEINITMDARSDTEGAKMLVDPLDNSSVGLITGYAAIADQILTKAGLIAKDVVIDVEVNDAAVFDLGDGDDRITTNTFATAQDDLSAGDGLGNRGLWVGGNGSETLDLTTVSVFRIGEVELNDAGEVIDNEQREAIADGWESRRKVFLDDVDIVDGEIVAGDTALDGNDMVKADATAFGNGVLTISDGYEAREFTDTGAGNDTFDLTARAFTTQVDASNLGQVTVLADNTTVASGLMTEQVDEGDFFMKQGNDTVLGKAFAAPALGLNPFAFVGARFDAAAYAARIDPAALPAGFVNRTTIAQGISQVSGDADNDGSTAETDPTVDLGDIDTGEGIDTLDGDAVAIGVSDVQAYGILLTQTVTGTGGDILNGDAEAIGLNVAEANGLSVGISNNTDNDGVEIRVNQAGSLNTGAGADILTMSAVASTATDGTARVASGLGDGTVVVSDANADANGILVDLGSTIDLGNGQNVVNATAEASDTGPGAGTDPADIVAANLAVTADGVENRGTLLGGDARDVITGVAEASSQGGVLLTIAGGIDNGFGSTRNDIPVAPTLSTGSGNDSLVGSGTVVAVGGIGLASGIETSGIIVTGAGRDLLEGTAISTVTDGIRAVADGIENARLETENGGLIDMGGGNDTLLADVTARGFGSDAEAIGIRNDFKEDGTVTSEGEIRLGAGNNTITADANAFSDSGSAIAFGVQGGSITAGNAVDEVTGRGIASGVTDVDAFGLSITDADMGGGMDRLTGKASATSKGVAEAQGISVGVDDAQIAVETGRLLTGDDGDRVEGRAEAVAKGAGLADANGVIVTIGSTLDTGDGIDVVDGTATATDGAPGGRASRIADGIDNGGTLLTGIGDDRVTGFGKAVANGETAIAAGIDNGVGASIDSGTTVLPMLSTDNGLDRIEGSAEALADSGDAISDGIENVGEINTSRGNDVIEADAVSDVASGAASDRSIADGIDNGCLVATGVGNDQLLATATATAADATAFADGIDNADRVDLGGGDDVVRVSATARSIGNDATANGINNDVAGEINLGAGNDQVRVSARAESGRGEATAIGINGGEVNAGAGNDAIRARSSDNLVGDKGIELAGGRGFGGDVEINMEGGDDLLFGFGEAVASGGAGIDELAFTFSLQDFQDGGGEIALGNPGINEVDFAFGGEILETDRFELFTFGRDTLSYDDLTMLG